MKNPSKIDLKLSYDLDHSQGFHFTVEYNLEAFRSKELENNLTEPAFENVESIKPNSLACQDDKVSALLLTHDLPSDLFIDPYQLETLISFRRKDLFKNKFFPQISINSRIELELPVYEVEPSLNNSFYILWALGDFERKSIQFSLPIHARYRKPGIERHHKIVVSSPSIKLSCIQKPQFLSFIDRNVFLKKNTVLLPLNISYSALGNNEWTVVSPLEQVLPLSQTKKLPSLLFTVPSGQLEHQNLVTGITLLFVLFWLTYIFTIARSRVSKIAFSSPPSSPISYNFAIEYPTLNNTTTSGGALQAVDLGRKIQ